MLFCTVALSFFFPFITLKSLLIYNIQKRIRCKSRRDVPISLLPLFTRLLRFSRSHEIRLRSLSRDKISARTDPLWAPFSLRSRFTNIPPRSVAPAARKTECIARESRSRRFLVRPHCRFFFLRNSGSVTTQFVAVPPGLRSRPRSRVREPDRRLAATSAA